MAVEIQTRLHPAQPRAPTSAQLPAFTRAAPASCAAWAGRRERPHPDRDCSLLILLLVNYYAFKHYHRFDYSREHKFTLSARTQNFLKSLSKPVTAHRVHGAAGPAPERRGQPRPRNTAAASHERHVSVEIHRPLPRGVGRAAEVQAKYKLAAQENVVIVDSEGRNKIISGRQDGRPSITAVK